MKPLRVGVVGVRGIGKYHAKWYARHGAEVVGWAVTSASSAREMEAMMQREFGLAGRGYAGLEALLRTEAPDAVSICSPAERHAEHMQACLEAGVHVLCEKPFLWEPAGRADAMYQRTAGLVAMAHRRRLVLAINTQYPACLPYYEQLTGPVTAGDARPRRFFWDMEIRDRHRGPAGVWIDTAPHALSLLLEWLPATQYTFADVRCRPDGPRLDVSFRCQTNTGFALDCHWVVSEVAGPAMKRRFGLDDRVVDVVSERTGPHEVATFLAMGTRRVAVPDMMEVSIARFLEACRGAGSPLADADRAALNMACLLELCRPLGFVH